MSILIPSKNLHSEGVCKYDGDTFTYFTKEDGLVNNQVRTIQEDGAGTIWFGTDDGVSSYDGFRMRNRTPPYTPSQDIMTKWVKSARDLWFNAGYKPGVYRYDGTEVGFLSFPKLKSTVLDNVYHTTEFAKGKNDTLWIATYAGILAYTSTGHTIINDESLGYTRETGLLHIRSIFVDSKGNLWVGNNGIGVLLKSGDTMINFSRKHNLIHRQSSLSGGPSPAGTLEHVFAIAEDRRGNIWFGDRDTGAWKYNGTTMTNYTTKDGLSDSFVLCIYEDTKGTLWFGLADGSICTFNGKSFDKVF